MPAALYAMTLRQGGALGNPVLVTHQGDVQTSRQYWSHLLCGECEERFNRNGERYAMTQVDNGQGRFPLFDRLRAGNAARSRLPRSRFIRVVTSG